MIVITITVLVVVPLIFWYVIGYGRKRGLPPGPCPWPIIGNLPQLGTVPHQAMAALALKHGPLMHLRLGQHDVVVASSAQVAAQFLKINDSNFSSRPPNSGAKHIAYNYQDLVFAPYGPRWRMLRKISAVHLFSAKALDDFSHVRRDEIALLVNSLAEKGNGVVNLGEALNLCAVNALGRVMLGYRVFGDGSGKSDPRAQEFKSMVVEIMVLAGVFNVGDFIPALDFLDLQGVAARMKALHARLDAFFSAILQDHKQGRRSNNNTVRGTSNTNTFLDTLLSLNDNDNDNDNSLSDTEIKALMLNMFTAGTDTTSSTVEWGVAELIRHPRVMRRLQEELDSVVGRDRAVCESDLARLTYLQAVVNEIFRLHPSTPLSLPRMADQACKVNGFHVPKGSTLLVNVWAIARDGAEWGSDALQFKPERFLEGGDKAGVDVRGNHFELIPFGAGRRICAGMSLGLRMVQLLTAALAHSFDWELPNGTFPDKLNMDEAYGLTLQRAAPLLVHPKPRLPKHLYA